MVRHTCGASRLRDPIPEPATVEAIRDAETRSGITIPTILRQLYLVADGLPCLGGNVFGIRNCSELAWFPQVEAELIDIWDGINQDGFAK